MRLATATAPGLERLSTMAFVGCQQVLTKTHGAAQHRLRGAIRYLHPGPVDW